VETNNSFTGWAIVEMMGHRVEVGYVTTEYYGGAALFRVDTPELPEREVTMEYPGYALVNGEPERCPAGSRAVRSAVPARSCLLAPAGLYALNPCTEEAARHALEKRESGNRPLILLEMPKRPPFDNFLPEPEPQDTLDHEDDDGDEDAA